MIAPPSRRLVRTALCWSLLALSPLAAQERHHPLPRRGDALVLSTGSSRGLAHAGALIALEYGGFDPDLVVGASMGAVIGALYAAGYSAADVRDLVMRSDWVDLFMPAPLDAGPAPEGWTVSAVLPRNGMPA